MAELIETKLKKLDAPGCFADPVGLQSRIGSEFGTKVESLAKNK
jgi:hypothetical protein